MTTTDDARLRRLKYRAWHRGFREADLILGPFADTHAGDLDPEGLDAFEALLEQPDVDLYAWIVGTAPAPARFEGVTLDMIRKFRWEAAAARGPDHGG